LKISENNIISGKIRIWKKGRGGGV
jgi:hypothetical protein